MFLSYVCIFLGATAITAGMLKRFTYRGQMVFDLNWWQAGLAWAGGILLIMIGMGLYVYASPASGSPEDTLNGLFG